MPRGAIGSTSDFDSEGSRFEAWRGIHYINKSMDKTKLSWPILKKLMIEFNKKVHTDWLPKCYHDTMIGQHPEGVALYNSSKKLCLVLIPKNASTTMMYSTMFYPSTSEWRLCNFLKENLEIDKFIVILRDPVKRYISATNMFLTSGVHMLPTSIRKTKIYSNDCHYHAQHEFIKRVPKDKIDFFYFDDKVVEAITNHYDLNFGLIPHHNLGKKVVTAVDEQLIKAIYQMDYELINSVKFLNI